MTSSSAKNSDSPNELSNVTLVSRSLFGGILMGLANLVPGISGGTMLLAAGIYPRFISAIAELTKFRFRFRSLLVLGCVGAAAGMAILVLAGVLRDLVVDQRWVMYSIFIGLTLGGIPLVWKLAKPMSPSMIVGGIVSFLAMGGLAYLQANNVVADGGTGPIMLFVAGLAGASAMILPGVSGGYLLLLLGQYIPILDGVDQFKHAIETRDIGAAMEPALSVVLPVGLGVVAGIVIVGNLLQWLLTHFRKVTLGVLLGLLIGSVFGLWPFKTAVEPQVGDTFKSRVLDQAMIAEMDTSDWPNEFFQPTGIQVASSLGLIVVGFGVTMGVALLGSQRDEENDFKSDDAAE